MQILVKNQVSLVTIRNVFSPNSYVEVLTRGLSLGLD